MEIGRNENHYRYTKDALIKHIENLYVEIDKMDRVLSDYRGSVDDLCEISSKFDEGSWLKRFK